MNQPSFWELKFEYGINHMKACSQCNVIVDEEVDNQDTGFIEGGNRFVLRLSLALN